MEIIKQEASLEVLNKDLELDGDLAWNVAQLIADADSDVRLAKGKFWNRCKYGTREEICDHFAWNYENMRKYGRYANEVRSLETGVTFTHWDKIRKAGIPQDNRPEWLQRAADNEWTPKQLTDEVLESQQRRVREIKKEALERDIEDGVVAEDTTTEDYDARRHEAHERSTAREWSIPKKTSSSMSLAEACEVFGMGQVSWMTEDTLDILYKGYSKRLHPDVAKDDGVAMQQLNRAKQIIVKITR